MGNFRTLITGVSLASLAFASPALAKPRRHHVAASSAQAEITALREEVKTLSARLDAQEAMTLQNESATRVVQSQATAAVTQAQAAQTAATAATAAAGTVPAQVQTAMDKAPKPAAPGWWGSTTVSGRMYFNASNIHQQSNGVDTAANSTGFNIKRFYVGVDHKFDDIFSANLTTDVSNVVGRTASGIFVGNPAVQVVGQPAGVTATANDYGLVGRGLYIKKAYLQAKLDPAFTVRVGSADLPWVPYVENLYGYRHVENILIDRTGFGTSADWGVHVLGDLADGIISYQVSVVDGAGYRNVKVTKSVDVEGRLSVAYKGFFGAIGGYTGKLGADVQTTPAAPVTTFQTASRFDGLLGFKNKRFTVGGEYFYAKNYSAALVTNAVGDQAEGYSVFGSVNLTSKFSTFGRYDHLTPRKTGIPGLSEDYFNVGVQYSPAKIVDLALVYKRDRVDGGTLATQNGAIGGTMQGTYDEFGVFGQFRF